MLGNHCYCSVAMKAIAPDVVESLERLPCYIKRYFTRDKRELSLT
jgi:hypothetical protein